MKIDIYCYLIVYFLTKLLQKCSWSGPLPNIPFCCNLLIGLVCMATKWQNLRFTKSTPQKLLGGQSSNFAELFLTLASIPKYCFFIAVAHALWLLWQFKISIDLQMEKFIPKKHDEMAQKRLKMLLQPS